MQNDLESGPLSQSGGIRDLYFFQTLSKAQRPAEKQSNIEWLQCMVLNRLVSSQ